MDEEIKEFVGEGEEELKEIDVPEVDDDIAAVDPLAEVDGEEKDEIDGGEMGDEEEEAYFYQDKFYER